MLLSRQHYKSKGLTDQNIDFLERMIPLSRTISSWTRDKAYDRDDPIATKYGVFPSVILAHCILRSIWGTHPVAASRYEGVDDTTGKPYWRHGNNIALIYADESWLERKRPFIKHGGAVYKSYRSIADCAVDFSDIISIRHRYSRLLLATTIEEQVKALSARAEYPELFKTCLTAIINQMELYRYDRY